MMTSDRRSFVGNGYTDLDRLAEELREHGSYGCDNAEQLRCVIASVLQEVLLRLPGRPEQGQREQELWNAVTGMVRCAQSERLIAEEWPDAS